MAGLDPHFRPTLRPGIRVVPTENPDRVAVVDTSRLVPGGVIFTTAAASLLELFTGMFSVAELTTAFATMPQSVPADVLHGVVAALDRALMLDSPAFAAYLAGPDRLPACVGAYPGDPVKLRRALDDLLLTVGRPGEPRDGPRLRAVLAPHMDFARGNITYAHAFKELAGRSVASVFVIVATSHYSGRRFSLTRKNFTTPLGTVPTDQAAINLLVATFGDEVIDDLPHLPEHSIELEVVWLQHLCGGRPFTIVPLLVGSFDDATAAGVSPAAMPDIARMVAALTALDESLGDRGCFVISGDLAHIGPKFRDPDPVTESQLSACRVQDERLLSAMTAADPNGYDRVIRDEENARRICGYPPTWLTLSALRPSCGKVLHYQQYLDPAGHECVSFAAAAFTD